jgi:hypothetical protein
MKVSVAGKAKAILDKSLLSIWLEKPTRWAILLVGIAILIFLTLMTAIPIDVTGPFDARTSEPAVGVQVGYSPAGAVMEPVTAIAQIIMGAPDMRVAAISFWVWFSVLVACTAAVSRLYGNHWQANWRTITGTLAAMGSGLFVLALYATFTVLVRIPNWRAVAQDRDIVLAELHTHTFSSFDGLISAHDCLRWHRQRGCDVVGLIGHKSLSGSIEEAGMAESDESLPGVLPGVEIALDNLGRIIAFGLREQLLRCPFDRHQRSFISWFQQNYQGVVVATEDRLNAGKLEEFADAGIDGFEVASDGHSCVVPGLHRDVLAVTGSHHLPMVASTDWHGIGSILRTWTAIRVPGAATLSRQQRAAAVLDALRRHDYSNITPIVVGRIGQVSLARAIFAPFTESIRYALGLSPLRLLAWWVWGMALFLLATALLHFGIHPGQMILAVIQVAMGIAVLISCLQLIIARTSGQAPYIFPAQVGLMASALGIAAVIFGIIGVCLAVARRQAR